MSSHKAEVTNVGNYLSVPVGRISRVPVSAAVVTICDERKLAVNMRPYLGDFRPQASKLAEFALNLRPHRAELSQMIRRGDGHGGRLPDYDDFNTQMLDLRVDPNEGEDIQRLKEAQQQELWEAHHDTFTASLNRLNEMAEEEDKLYIAADMPNSGVPSSGMAFGRLAGFRFGNPDTYSLQPIMGLQDGSEVPLHPNYQQAWPFALIG
jgi:hypothetical protein